MVEIKLKNLKGTKKKISITVNQDEIATYRQKAYQKVSSQAKLKGFRPGKIPQNILDQYYTPEIEHECLNFLISDTYVTALKNHNLIPLTEPHFDAHPFKKEADYSFSVEIETRPEIELKDYKGLTLKKQTVTITDEELTEELKQLQESLSELSPATTDSKMSKGLVATIDFAGKIDDKPFPGGQAKDYLFEYGNKVLLEDFEAHLSDMAVGEEREFTITFPKDYFDKNLAAKQAHYTVKLKALHNKKLPEIDDELAKDLGKENLETLKQELKDSIRQRKERGFHREYAEQVKAIFKKEYDFDLPEGIINSETERTKQDQKEVIDQLRVEFVMEAIARKENIQATPPDVQNHMAALSQIYRQPLDEVRKIYSQPHMINTLVSQIVFDKTMNYIIENAQWT